MSGVTFRDAMPLGAARVQLRELVDVGHECPCCRQLAKVYRRKITSGQARGLIAFWLENRRDWGYAPDIDRRFKMNGIFALMRYWGLIEEQRTRRDDGGRAGWWRITDTGEAFIHGGTIPKYARLYNGRSLGLSGDPVTIHDALGTKFRYDELMAGV